MSVHHLVHSVLQRSLHSKDLKRYDTRRRPHCLLKRLDVPPAQGSLGTLHLCFHSKLTHRTPHHTTDKPYREDSSSSLKEQLSRWTSATERPSWRGMHGRLSQCLSPARCARVAVGGRVRRTSDAITFEPLGVVRCPLDMSQWHLSGGKDEKKTRARLLVLPLSSVVLICFLSFDNLGFWREGSAPRLHAL